jgi:hypothetical protein
MQLLKKTYYSKPASKFDKNKLIYETNLDLCEMMDVLFNKKL